MSGEWNNKIYNFFMLILIIFGLLLTSCNEVLEFFQKQFGVTLCCWNIFTKIGEATFIAGLLGLIVDPYVKKNLSKEVLAENAIKFLMPHLDNAIQDEVSALVRIGFNPCRENLRVNYRLIDSNMPQGYVQAIIKLEYTVSNNSDEKKLFTHRVSVKKIPESVQVTDKDKQILEVRGENVCMSTFSKDTGSYVLERRRGNDKQLGYIDEKDNNEGTRKIWEKNVFIPAKSKSNFTSKYMQILPVTYEETLPSKWPTKNVIVDVEHPESMDVFVAFNHRCKDQFTTSGKRWKFDYVMLPYQAIYIRWRPKK